MVVAVVAIMEAGCGCSGASRHDRGRHQDKDEGDTCTLVDPLIWDGGICSRLDQVLLQIDMAGLQHGLAYRERDALAYPAVHSVVLCRWDAMIGRVPAHLGVAEESEIPGQEDASSSNDGVQVHRTDDGVQVRRSDDDI